MVSPSHFAAFAALVFLMVVVPGPSVLFTVSRALTVGRRDALITVLGNAAGVYAQVVAIAFGMGAIVQTSTTVFTVIKLAGAAYLVYLGVQAVRRRRKLSEALANAVRATPGRTMAVLRDGFVVGFANPKSIVFLAAVLPQFVDHSAGRVPLQIIVLGIALPVIAVVSDSAWALVAGTARAWFARSPKRLELVGGTGGLVMIGLGAGLAVNGRSD
ncbi:LysE family translocator [Amycolatopsis endophytica]|uniref:Threonine/homoserine/homoserine lactone efflux protein n=1 Tax=Amycolatopsis endophytica TaxID=860233 RepID=A0A853B7S5_9PSEU|nr:LysE family translocator [Amycolatopsis endophytica]NYI91149.1 threonine/homoserine/homoserine lactone efflux protein [Amycolatopsis endophytica]